MRDATAAVAAPEPAALDGARSMCDVLLRTAAAHAARTALRTPDGAMELTYRECLERIARIAAGLRDLGVGHGQPLGLMLVNRPEFHLVDAAAMLIGATPFSVYNTFPAEQVAYVLGNADARVLITEARYLDVVRAADVVETIVLIDGEAEGCLPLAALEASEPIDLGVAAEAVTGEDVLTLIYTSGTTGPPKAVEITHANMLAELRAVHAVMPLPGGGRQVSFLPAAHIADRWTSHYSAFMAYANTVTTVAEMQRVMDVVAEVKPTMFAAVPRVWEKTKAALESGFDGDLAAAARADSHLAARVRARLGLDDAAWLITGAAPTSLDVVEFFACLGLPLCEALGMSETACLVATNTPAAMRFGSVGRAVDGAELRLDSDGELLIRGPVVMRGYRGMPEATREAIDPDGWLHTGDIGRIDDDGFLWIVDRKKELIINAAGKNMSPTTIEAKLTSAGPLIGQACVIGDRRPYNVALLVLDPVASAELNPTDPTALSRVADEVAAANARLARVEQIKRFRVLDGEWLPGGDELTPTMKLKRNEIAHKYAGEIEELYSR